MSEIILNIASGKILPVDRKHPSFIVNVDTMFYLNNEPAHVEDAASGWVKKIDRGQATELYNVKCDAFEFMENTIIPFDRVCIYRFLEHVSFTKVLYFIYLVSTVTERGGTVDVIVPNYEILARMILDEIPLDGNFEANNILLTTELLNEPSCPHASIWTPSRAEYFWELEGRFKVKIDSENYDFDGRQLYLRFFATRR